MHTQLAAVIEGLVDAAVAELQRLEEERPVVGARGAREERHEAFRVQTENREKLSDPLVAPRLEAVDHMQVECVSLMSLSLSTSLWGMMVLNAEL
ncbi:hypothetical protein GOODEAATRI_024696 [Goodea atripinnis]|uniref:Uncharacterized protein n=1 Tax=Goodea atripinnis TaxID=208336 RepID=A0ABV0N4C0_9TELE